MRRISKYILLLLIVALMPVAINAEQKTKDTSTRKERDYIKSGNKLYNDKRYAEAEVEYRKALQANPSSMVASYNLATSLMRQSGGTNAKDENSPLKKATDMYLNITKSTKDANLLSKTYYNLGNIAYNQEQYEQSVEYYKNALRKNPNDDQARDNLRLAQLKLKNQNKDKNKDKDKDKDKDKNKDQNKDKQDQNKDQNKDNKDQNKQQSQPQGGMSDDNVEQILKTMQNQENATQQKINAEKRQLNKHKTGNQW